MKEKDLMLIADILMGAAYADGRYKDEEAIIIEHILLKLVQQETLPVDIQARLWAFDHTAFNLEATCFESDFGTPEKRSFLLQMVALVPEVDQELDLDESAYLIQVAKCLGARKEEYRDLVVEFSSTAAGESVPPPIPPAFLEK